MTVRAPGARAGIGACRIRMLYLSDQVWKIQRKEYTSAFLTGCSVRKIVGP